MVSTDRYALIVAVDRYDHAQMDGLQAPAADADALSEVLGRADLGRFNVTVIHNATASEILRQIEDFFTERKSTDLALLHFSGHGLKTVGGQLHLAGRNTVPDRLTSTAIEAEAVRKLMVQSRARSAVLLLDCCYSGAIHQGFNHRGGNRVDVEAAFNQESVPNGKGRAVITASDAVQYAFEGQSTTATGPLATSVFTSAIVEGIATGAADRDRDGQVSLAELFDYVSDHVRSSTPFQTPSKSEWGLQESIVISRTPTRRNAAALPSHSPSIVTTQAEDQIRAVMALGDQLDSANLSVAAAALRNLQNLCANDDHDVRHRAITILRSREPWITDRPLDFGVVVVGTSAERTTEVNGPPLARSASASASVTTADLSAWISEGRLYARFLPTRVGNYRAVISVRTATGVVEVPVHADVRLGDPGQTGGPRSASPSHGDRRRLMTAISLCAVGLVLLIAAGFTPLWPDGRGWLSLVSKQSDVAWWMSIAVVPVMFAGGTIQLIGLGLAAGAAWTQLFVALQALLHVFTTTAQPVIMTLLLQITGALLILGSRVLLISHRSEGQGQSPFESARPTRWAGAMLVAVGMVALVGLQMKLLFYQPSDVYLFVAPLAGGSIVALGNGRLRLRELPLILTGATYGALAALFFGTWLLLVWCAVIAAGWLLSRFSKTDSVASGTTIKDWFRTVTRPGFER